MTVDPNVGKEFIEHFGTKGMRWGVRRSREERARGSGKEEDKKESKKSSSAPKKVVGKTNTVGKSPANLSDAQLQKVIQRMNMEQQYAKLTDPGPSMTKRILNSTTKFATQAARNVAMTQVTNAANAEASKRIAGLMAKRAAKLATQAA